MFACSTTGRFQSAPGQQTCNNCQSGSFTNVTGSTVCERCSKGRFQSYSGRARCDDCGFVPYFPLATFCL